MRVLVAAADDVLRETAVAYLRAARCHAEAAANAARMWQLLQHAEFDIVAVELAGEDGFALLRALRSHSAVPIIALTIRGDATERIVALEVGADDCSELPIEPRELLARIKAILRRARGEPALPVGRSARFVRFAGWTLDSIARHVATADMRVDLSVRDLALLEAFLRHPGRVLSREQLRALAGDGDGEADPRTIDAQVSRLRRKLRAGDSAGDVIKTVRGGGYVFAASAEVVR